MVIYRVSVTHMFRVRIWVRVRVRASALSAQERSHARYHIGDGEPAAL